MKSELNDKAGEYNSTRNSKNNSRIDIRLSEDRKEFLAQAAELAGFKNVSEFIITTMQERALDIFNRSEVYINYKDFLRVQEALVNPDLPNEALNKAFKKYGKMG